MHLTKWLPQSLIVCQLCWSRPGLCLEEKRKMLPRTAQKDMNGDLGYLVPPRALACSRDALCGFKCCFSKCTSRSLGSLDLLNRASATVDYNAALVE